MSEKVPPERREFKRFTFAAAIRVVQSPSGKRITAQVNNLSLLGCHVETSEVLPLCADVRLEMTHGDTTLRAIGVVTHSNPEKGMGIFFTRLATFHEAILRRWLAQMQDHAER